MQSQHSTKFLRRRKFLLVLPVLVLPFITLAFWAMGGGQVTGTRSGTATTQTGLNMELPGASFKEDKLVDKLGYYEKASDDSARMQELIRNDPYYTKADTAPGNRFLVSPGIYGETFDTNKSNDLNETKVYQKLTQLNTVLNEATSGTKQQSKSYLPSTTESPESAENIERLDQMMKSMNNVSTNEDGEMKQLNGMLDKILDIQHPERIKEKWKGKSAEQEGKVFVVSTEKPGANINLLDAGKQKSNIGNSNGFYGAAQMGNDNERRDAIEAVVHNEQLIVNGAVVKMRLLNDIYINGKLIPKDNFVFGTATLNNERLEISINSIRNEYTLFAVKMEVYDLDGLPGIYIPGAITRDVAKQSTDNALQSVALNSLDPSIGAQAATAGIEAAKTLLSKKVKLVKVQVKAGYRILLKDNQQSQ
ncbi:MAG: conjugative transposon protein TraM [Ferruginibacter sp.]